MLWMAFIRFILFVWGVAYLTVGIRSHFRSEKSFFCVPGFDRRYQINVFWQIYDNTGSQEGIQALFATQRQYLNWWGMKYHFLVVGATFLFLWLGLRSF